MNKFGWVVVESVAPATTPPLWTVDTLQKTLVGEGCGGVTCNYRALLNEAA